MSNPAYSQKTHKVETRVLLFNLLWSGLYTLIIPFLVFFIARSKPTLGKLFATLIIIILMHILMLFFLSFLYEMKANKERRVGNLQSAGILIMIAPGNCLLAMAIYKMLGGGGG